MRCIQSAVIAAAASALLSFAPSAGASKLLRFPNVHHDRIVFSYAGDLWTVGTQGGNATRLTSNPGVELFGKFSPDGRFIAFTGQYGGDEQVYVIAADGGAPKQLTFYPAAGPLADRWGYDNQVYGWTPDGASVLFRSARDGYMLTDSKLYTVPMSGGAATALPMPVSGAGQFSPDGKKIVYSPLWRDFRSENRYQGGWANDLYIFDLTHPSLLQVTDDPRTDRDPMWIGDAVYFNSDRTGVFNLYRYDIATRKTQQLTHYQDWDVRWPSADAEGQIVYESDGELHIYDTRSDQDRAVSIAVPADATIDRPQAVNAADNIESLGISPGGERLNLVARGDVYSVPIEHGVTRNLTQSSSAHDREAAWSNDGKQLAYVSDRSGEEEIYIQAQDGNSSSIQLTSNSTARYYAPRWSGDDKRIAFADNTGRLHCVEVSGRRRGTIVRDPTDMSQDYRWSPDGQYLSYTLNEPNAFAGVYIWSVADGKSRRVTPPLFNAQSPAWSPNGELLYFLSEREYQPQLSTIEFDFAADRQTGIFAVTLRKDVKNPFGLRDQEPGDANDDEDTDKSSDKNKSKSKSKSKGKSKREHKDKVPLGPITIDFDGIETRVIRVPLEADNLTHLQIGDESLLYQRNGAFYYGREPNLKSSVMAYSIKEREAKLVAEDVTEWSATADGKHVLAQLSSKEIKYFEVGKSDEAKIVSLAGLATTRIPAAEWREMFAEVWRRYRDYKAGTDPYELLQAPANQPVEWRVSAVADGSAARTIRYQPLASESSLLYLRWVNDNRARVQRMSAGRLGYIHIPDMGEAGIREFIKWWYPQVRKEGLVVDVRDNGGGNISELLIERLARTLHGTSFARNRDTVDTYPRVVQAGPKVALINEDTSSDGDIFAYEFRQWKIGPLIGKRTWGGAVGIEDHGPLLDGGTVFVPEFGTADEKGRWIIEGHGVDPDIIVEQDPVEVLQGRDPQLERGVEELMKLLPTTPAGLPRRSPAPVKTEVH